MDIHYTDVYIVEQIRIEFDAITWWEKDHDFFILLLLQKGEKQLEFFICIYHHKSLL